MPQSTDSLPPGDPCPKCRGKLLPEQDEYGPYLRCHQCGTHIQRGPREPTPPPEQTPRTPYMYRTDDGCEVSTSCLHCPLPTCKHEDPKVLNTYRREQKDQERFDIIVKENLKNDQAAKRLGLDSKTVRRIINRHQSRHQQE